MPMNDLPDAELITRVLAGETACYRPLVIRYQNRLHAMVTGMVRNHEDAKDIVQMAFVKAYQSLSGFRIDSSFYTWIYRISMNLAIDHCRKGKRRKTTSYEEAVASRDDDGNLADQHHEESPGVALARKELHERIYAALDEVSEDMREAILLREVEGLSYKEIADRMGIPEGTVMSRLFYARKKLQAILKSGQAD
jgi:RNA polymerase sigma-70 factor, ECF subfamily